MARSYIAEVIQKSIHSNTNIDHYLIRISMILSLKNYSNNDCFKLVKSNQEYIIQNEKNKYKNCVSIFNNVLGKE